jgi:hypothetical protein
MYSFSVEVKVWAAFSVRGELTARSVRAVSPPGEWRLRLAKEQPTGKAYPSELEKIR